MLLLLLLMMMMMMMMMKMRMMMMMMMVITSSACVIEKLDELGAEFKSRSPKYSPRIQKVDWIFSSVHNIRSSF